MLLIKFHHCFDGGAFLASLDSSLIALILASCSCALVLALVPGENLFSRLIKRFRRRDGEAERRRFLLEHGRVVEGIVLDLIQDGVAIDTDRPINPGAQTTINYRYTISSVTYESFHELTQDQLKQIEQYMPGRLVSVRYDPRSPVNSLVE